MYLLNPINDSGFGIQTVDVVDIKSKVDTLDKNLELGISS